MHRTCWHGHRVKNSCITDDFQRNGFVRRIVHRFVEIHSRCSQWRILPLTIFTIFVLLSTPLSGAYSGLAWAGAAQSDSVSGKTVTFSPSGNIVASGHSATVLLSNSTTHESIQTLYVDFFVQSIAFTSDEQFMIVGMESTLPNTPASIVFEWDGSEYVRTKHTEDGMNVDRISVSSDDLTFATATENGDIAEWKMDTGIGSTLDLDRQYLSPHAGHITCLDHSPDGQYLLSGAQDGIVILWERMNQTEINRWETSEPITDCGFSNDGSTMAWIGGGSLYLRNNDATQSYRGQHNIQLNSTRMSFLSSGTEIALLVPDLTQNQMRNIDFISIESLPYYVSRTMLIPHHAEMFSIHPNDHTIAIATNSDLVAFYSSIAQTTLELTSLTDTDQDNIPDIDDDDDDGDGILDAFDNVCSAGTNCDLNPNQEYIRNIQIDIDGSQITITDSIYLDSRESAYLRQLISTSVTSAKGVNLEEFNQAEDSICGEYSQSEVKSRWNTHLTIEGQAFNSGSVVCQIGSGLYNTLNSDKGTRIEIRWIVTGTIPQPVTAPYNVTLDSGLSLPSSSIAQTVHTFPSGLHFTDSSGSRIDFELWNRRDPTVEALMPEPPVDNPTEIDTALDLVVEYWYLVILLIGTVGLGLFLIVLRRSNAVDFADLEDKIEDDAEDEEWEQMVEDVAAWDEVLESESVKKKPTPPDAVKRDLRRQPKPPSAVRKDLDNYHEDGDSEYTPRKKAKRKKSTDDQDSDNVQFKQLISKDETGTIDSEGEDDDMMKDALPFITSTSEEKKEKRRRPVRRKKSND